MSTTTPDPYEKLERVDEFLEAARNTHQQKLDSLKTARRKTSNEIEFHEDLQEFRESDSDPTTESKLSQYRKRLEAIKTAQHDRKHLLNEIHEARTIVTRLRLADSSDLNRWLGPLNKDLGLDDDATDDVETLRAVIQVLEQLGERCLSDEELNSLDDEHDVDIQGTPGNEHVAGVDAEVANVEMDADSDGDSEPQSLVELGETDEFTGEDAELGDH